MEERLKHRIVGIAVIVALLAIFAPLFFKNVQMPGSEKGRTKHHAPPPPTAPQVNNAKKMPTLALRSATDNINDNVDHIARINLDKPVKNQQNELPKVPQLKLKAMHETSNAKSVASNDQHRNLILGKNQDTAEPQKPSKAVAAHVTKQVVAHSSHHHIAEKKIATRKTKLKHIAKREIEKKAAVKLAAHAKSHKVVAKAKHGKDWVIQLGVFSEKVNAEKLMKEMHAKGFPSFIRSAKNSQGKLITHVFVGPMPQRASADSMHAKIQKMVKINGMVMPENG